MDWERKGEKEIPFFWKFFFNKNLFEKKNKKIIFNIDVLGLMVVIIFGFNDDSGRYGCVVVGWEDAAIVLDTGVCGVKVNNIEETKNISHSIE